MLVKCDQRLMLRWSSWLWCCVFSVCWCSLMLRPLVFRRFCRVVFNEVVESDKRYMRDVTVVSRVTLPLNLTLAQYSQVHGLLCHAKCRFPCPHSAVSSSIVFLQFLLSLTQSIPPPPPLCLSVCLYRSDQSGYTS